MEAMRARTSFMVISPQVLNLYVSYVRDKRRDVV